MPFLVFGAKRCNEGDSVHSTLPYREEAIVKESPVLRSPGISRASSAIPIVVHFPAKTPDARNCIVLSLVQFVIP